MIQAPLSQEPVTEAAAVRLAGVRKAYGDTPVLRGVDLDIEQGSITAVLGASGSGKTTLLRVLAGFERVDSGTVRLGPAVVDGEGPGGSRVRTLAPERRRIGYVPQDGALFPHLTVRGNVGFAHGGGWRGRRGREEHVDRLLELAGLTPFAARYPHELSGGQQQRVALARALAHDPTVVLLDEPFSALDAALRASVREQVLEVLRATGTTAVLVTHDQDEALSMTDRVAVLRDGVIAQHGSAQEIYDTPADPELARFVGDANLLPGALLGGGLVDVGPLGRLRLRDGVPGGAGHTGAGTVLVRPEQLTPAGPRTGSSTDTAGAVLEARVERCEYFGHDTMLTVRPVAVEDYPQTLSVRLPEGVRIAEGATVSLTVRGPVTAWHTA